jgi:hypothetical protein
MIARGSHPHAASHIGRTDYAITKIALTKVPTSLLECAVHRGGIVLKHVERFPKEIDANVMEERGELLLPSLPSCLPYASERLGHTSPTLCSVCALLAALGSTGSAAGCPALFVSFTAHHHLIDPIRPTRGHIAVSPHSGLYAMPSLCGST